MKENALSLRLRHQLAILAQAGCWMRSGQRVLDFGCGEGESVAALRAAGFDAYGCDVELRATPRSQTLIEQGFVREIVPGAYRLPFEDESFDIVLSDEVFEHVQNYPQALAELYRVMKAGAMSLHIFPARWNPIEPHVQVPFASVIRATPWLWLWALLGVRNPHQRGLGVRETVAHNRAYLDQQTIYLRSREIAAQFRRLFPRFQFAEASFLQHSRRGNALYRYLRYVPGLPRLYRACRSRVVLAGK